MKLSSNKFGIYMMVVGLCLAPVERLAAQGVSSLIYLDLESERNISADESLIAENKALKEKLASAQTAMSALQNNFGIVPGGFVPVLPPATRR